LRLRSLDVSGNPAADLSSLRGTRLKELACDPRTGRAHAEVLRSINSLETINGRPAAEFWPEPTRDPTAVAPPTDDAGGTRIAALPPAEQVEEVRTLLKQRNPDFDGTLVPTVEGGVVTGLHIPRDPANRHLLSDLSPVRALTGLKSFGCENARELSDLSPLKGLKLTRLKVWNSRVTDLSPIRGMALTELDLWVTPVADLSPIADMTSLTTLNLSMTRVTDLSALRGLKLTALEFGRTPVADLSPLAGLKLTSLRFNETPVADLSPLRGMPLAELTCRQTQVTDLSPVRDLPLTRIECDFRPERDAAVLRAIWTLETINGKPAAEFWKGVGRE
jgi:Leucine-rich repeat (LRR) protein